MANLHQGVAFSPQTTLSENIGAADTIIKVSDSSVFPDPPNYATIGTDELGETIEYAAKAEGLLSGCTRGVEGTAKAWKKGDVIARNFTAKDHNDMITAVTAAQQTATAANEKADAALPATNTAVAATKLATARTIQVDLSSSQAEQFDGTADVTPGVSGILPIAHGGTNAVTAAQALENLGGLPLSGGTMTGQIHGLPAPTADSDAANKGYVDSSVIRPNLLDNWYFANPVNQRGETEYTGNIYGIDRWGMKQNSSNKVTVNEKSITATLYRNGFFYQCLDHDLSNKEVTISFLTADNQLFDFTEIFPTQEVQQKIFYFDYNGAKLCLYIQDSPSNQRKSLFLYLRNIPSNVNMIEIELIAVKLELGSTQTLAHKEGDTWVLNEIPDYGTELAKCQRYYIQGRLRAFPYLYTNVSYDIIYLPVTLRSVPSIIGSPRVYLEETNTHQPDAIISVWECMDNHVTFKITNVPGKCYIDFANNGALSAEL